ncbi:hypothetical protein GCM10010277_07500 [Streptomyces longisporoflavus]|nr:hypothetical protein GCM10010277_07500 [Streptomyces longisporoflavus]
MTVRDCAPILTRWADPAQLAIVPSSASALRSVPRRWFQCRGRAPALGPVGTIQMKSPFDPSCAGVCPALPTARQGSDRIWLMGESCALACPDWASVRAEGTTPS